MTARQEETWYKIMLPWISENELYNKYQEQKAENALLKLLKKITLKLYYGIDIIRMIKLT